MMERKQIILDENDVKKIIAREYRVDLEDIEIEISKGDPQYPRLSMCIVINHG